MNKSTEAIAQGIECPTCNALAFVPCGEHSHDARIQRGLEEFSAGKRAAQAGERQHDGLHIRSQPWLDGFASARANGRA